MWGTFTPHPRDPSHDCRVNQCQIPRDISLHAMAAARTETRTSSAEKPPGPAKLNKDPTIAQIFDNLEYGPAPEAASSVNSWLDEHGRDFGHFVNGKWLKPEGRKVYDSRNPATGWL